jgi:hypothetical protein
VSDPPEAEHPKPETDQKGCEFIKGKIDGFVKSPLCPLIVIPAKAGIHSFQANMDSRFRGNDSVFDFLRFHQD